MSSLVLSVHTPAYSLDYVLTHSLSYLPTYLLVHLLTSLTDLLACSLRRLPHVQWRGSGYGLEHPLIPHGVSVGLPINN